MKTMFAMIEKQHYQETAKQTMTDMVMPGGGAMPAGSM
jgi:hypothetical protein